MTSQVAKGLRYAFKGYIVTPIPLSFVQVPHEMRD